MATDEPDDVQSDAEDLLPAEEEAALLARLAEAIGPVPRAIGSRIAAGHRVDDLT
jgi:hypothetical protein